MEIDSQKLINAWMNDKRFGEWMTGSVSTYERMKKTFIEFDLPLDETKMRKATESRIEAHRKWLQPLPTATQTLSELKARGIRCGLMSMCSGEVPELWDQTAFADVFVVSHFSCVIELNKDNEDFYTKTLDALGSIPSETVYIGDSINELIWAQRLGMIPVLKTRDSVKASGTCITADTAGEYRDPLVSINRNELNE